MTDILYENLLRADDMSGDYKISSGFFSRAGGSSTGVYHSLNCGYGSRDDVQSVHGNRARVAQALGFKPDRLVGLHQVHSNIVHVVERVYDRTENPKADALVTRVGGIGLSVLTADCVPVLFADSKAGVVGAAHAGWRGATSGIVENVVDAMVLLGAYCEHLHVAIGPAISASYYEVGQEVIDIVHQTLPDCAERLLSPCEGRAGHALFDLKGYVAERLYLKGVSHVHISSACTYRDEGHYFSYRRMCHRNEADYGRQISVIGLRA